MWRERTVVGGGGCELFVREAGPRDAPPVVLVHGYNQCGLAFRRQLRSDLTRDHRVVTFDLRGHGRSAKPQGAYADPALWAADVQAVIDGLALHRPVLVGWSYGGVVVLDHLAERGQHGVAGLVLVGAVSSLGTRAAVEVLGPDFLAVLPRMFSDAVADSGPAVTEFLRLTTAEPMSDEELYLTAGYNHEVPPYVRREMNTRRVDHEPLLRGLAVPLLLVHGDRDRVVLPAAAQRHQDLVPAARHAGYAGVGHTPFYEQPVRFVHEVGG